jgi:hypothetical protein
MPVCAEWGRGKQKVCGVNVFMIGESENAACWFSGPHFTWLVGTVGARRIGALACVKAGVVEVVAVETVG